ncbi:hypothetical protein P7C70_g6993, partial [Phenoliferia sp. Uapishka_3]
RLWGWKENAIEQTRDLSDLSALAAQGKPLYGTTDLPEYVQGVAHRNSVWSQLKFGTLPWGGAGRGGGDWLVADIGLEHVSPSPLSSTHQLKLEPYSQDDLSRRVRSPVTACHGFSVAPYPCLVGPKHQTPKHYFAVTDFLSEQQQATAPVQRIRLGILDNIPEQSTDVSYIKSHVTYLAERIFAFLSDPTSPLSREWRFAFWVVFTEFAPTPETITEEEHQVIWRNMDWAIKKLEVQLVFAGAGNECVGRDEWAWVEGEDHLKMKFRGMKGHNSKFMEYYDRLLTTEDADERKSLAQDFACIEVHCIATIIRELADICLSEWSHSIRIRRTKQTPPAQLGEDSTLDMRKEARKVLEQNFFGFETDLVTSEGRVLVCVRDDGGWRPWKTDKVVEFMKAFHAGRQYSLPFIGLSDLDLRIISRPLDTDGNLATAIEGADLTREEGSSGHERAHNVIRGFNLRHSGYFLDQHTREYLEWAKKPRVAEVEVVIPPLVIRTGFLLSSLVGDVIL